MRFQLISILHIVLCVNSLPLIEKSGEADLSNSTSVLAVVQPQVDNNVEKNETLAPEQVVSKGTCDETRRPLIYTEHFILNSDKKSQVLAGIKIQMSGDTKISCVEIFDMKRANDRPRLIDGGPGNNYVEVGINPDYGDGFAFTVKLYGDYYL